MTKALLHELGKSLSFGRLSLKAKVLWPMLLASSDDQGRGLAEPDAVKWYVCPNVPEIVVDDVAGLLGEMCAQNMIVTYDTERGLVYQVVRWWEFQQLRWARHSRYPAPPHWTDRIRYSNRGDLHTEQWDQDGGFCTENCTENPRDFQPNLTQPNSTQPNLTDDAADAATASASAPLVREAHPKLAAELTADQYAELDRMLETHITSPSHLVGALSWARCKGMGSRDLPAIAKAAIGWRDVTATGPPGDNGKTAAQLAAEDFLAEEV